MQSLIAHRQTQGPNCLSLIEVLAPDHGPATRIGALAAHRQVDLINVGQAPSPASGALLVLRPQGGKI